MADLEAELAGYRGQLTELQQLLDDDPTDQEIANLVKEVQLVIAGLEQAELETKQAEPKDTALPGSPPEPKPPAVAGGAVEKRRKKKKEKHNALEVRANAWQAFNGKSGNKKSMFSSPAEGAVGRVGFHGSKNTRTENPERKRWK